MGHRKMHGSPSSCGVFQLAGDLIRPPAGTETLIMLYGNIFYYSVIDQ